MARNIAFRIVVAYENLDAGIRARHVSERLAAQLEPDVEIQSDLWKFDMLSHPKLRENAVSEASNADMIIISAKGEQDLPDHVKSWVDGWLPTKKGGASALVALLDQDQETPGEPSRLRSYLRQMALKASMDFFCQSGNWSKENGYKVEGLQTRSESTVTVLDETDIHAGVSRGWGINE